MKKFLVCNRSFFSLLIPLIFVIIATPQVVLYFIGVGIALLGESIRLWASGYIKKAEELSRSGPYAYTRNPLYLGSFLITLGYCTMSGLVYSYPILLGLYFIFYFVAIVEEEKFLREKFEGQYLEYCERVPRFLPSLKKHYSNPAQQFSWEQVVKNKESRTLAGVILMCVLFAVKFWIGG